MFQNIRTKRASEEEGFTLIELMVVVLIIAILLLIAIPTFLGARERAQDRAAQSNLRNAITNAKTIFTDHEDYQEATPSALNTNEPSLTFQTATSDDAKKISVATPDDTTIVMAAKSNSGTCFLIKDSVGAGGPGTQYAKGSCDASAPGSPSWSTNGW